MASGSGISREERQHDIPGHLGFNKKNAEDRKNALFGMLTQNSEKSAHLSKSALFDAAVALNLVSDKKPNGQPRRRQAAARGPSSTRC